MHQREIVTTTRNKDAAWGSLALPPNEFFVTDEIGAHAIRQLGRLRALKSAKTTRQDTDDIGNIDIEASSDPVWKKIKAALSENDASMLRIFRGGAIKTPTRITPQGVIALCPDCGAPHCSSRHLVLECPQWRFLRLNTATDHGLPDDFLVSLPRVTLKSGWVTRCAHQDPQMRVRIQVGVCKIAISIMQLRDWDIT